MTDEVKQLGDIKLIRKIASGGMAEIWEGRQTGVEGFEKRLAVKMILPHFLKDEDFLSLFLDEGRLAAKLNHPNICQLFKLEESEGTYFTVMEYIDGIDLRSLLKKARTQRIPLPLEHSVKIIIDVCAALDYAHSCTDINGEPLNIVHRDISPSNIMVTRRGNVKVVDFGIAKAATQIHHTRTGVLRGKCAYMAPEQVNEDPLDQRSDLFCVGIVLWEMITGRQLFQAAGELPKLMKITAGNYPRPTEVYDKCPKELEDIVMKALAYEPDERYQNCGEFHDALEDFALEHKLAMSQRRIASYINKLTRQDPPVKEEQLTASLSPVSTPPARSNQDKIAKTINDSNTPAAFRKSAEASIEDTGSEILANSKTISRDDLQQVFSEEAATTTTNPGEVRNLKKRETSKTREGNTNAKRILVTDDSDAIRQTVVMLLEASGYKVKEAQDGLEAVEKVKAEIFDLCLLDLDMPRMDGREALKQIKRLRPSLPCIIQTAHNSFQTAAEMGRLGATTYLLKPTNSKQLLETIKQTLGQRPEGEDLEQTIHANYPTPLAELRYRFRRSSSRESMDRSNLLKAHHALLATQYEMISAIIGSLSLSYYIQDGAFDNTTNQLFKESTQQRITPDTWIRLLRAIGNLYREQDRPFFCQELRDLFWSENWTSENDLAQCQTLIDVLSPLIGNPHQDEEIPLLYRCLQVLANYHEEMWKEHSFLTEQEISTTVKAITPFLTTLFEKLYRLIDFHLIRVESAEPHQNGTHHETTLLRGLSPHPQSYLAKEEALQNNALYLFTPTNKPMFPLLPFVVTGARLVDNNEPTDLAFPVHIRKGGRLMYRSMQSGRLHRPDQATQELAQALLSKL